VDDLLQLRELHALRSVIDRLSVGPLRGCDASAKFDELLLRDVDAEGADCVVFGCGDRQTGEQADSTKRC
jgi:hypothetical protein